MKRTSQILTILFGTAMLLPAMVCAQFVTTNINISPRVETAQVLPMELENRPHFETAGQVLQGIQVLQISANENVCVVATLKHDPQMVNQQGHQLPLDAQLAYTNNGKQQEPSSDSFFGRVEFKMNNSGLLIQTMEPRPNILHAYLYLKATTGLPQFVNTPYEGSIYLTIEFN